MDELNNLSLTDPRRVWDLDGTEYLSIWNDIEIEKIQTDRGLLLRFKDGPYVGGFSTHRNDFRNIQIPWWESHEVDIASVMPPKAFFPQDEFSEDELAKAIEFIES